MDKLSELLAELAADAAAAQEYERLAEERRERVRLNLPKARKAGAGVAQLERTIGSLYVQRTISRWTADSQPEGKPRSTRKRPGAGPSDS